MNYSLVEKKIKSMYLYPFLNGLLLSLFAKENHHLRAIKVTPKLKKRYLK